MSIVDRKRAASSYSPEMVRHSAGVSSAGVAAQPCASSSSVIAG